jgi:hypothetical protein
MKPSPIPRLLPSPVVAGGGRLSLLAIALGALLSTAAVAAAATPMPAPVATAGGVTIEAQPLLGGHVRPGSWAAVKVKLANDGPSLSGELRIKSTQQGRSQYGIAVELPSGARQEHTLYAQAGFFGSRLRVELVDAANEAIVSTDAQVRSHDAFSPMIAIVAQRPESVQAGVRDVQVIQNGPTATIITLTTNDLPERVEAWSAIDRLVWQDVDAAQLSTSQREAMRLWLGAGGRLVVVGGTAGVGPLAGFEEDLLPFRPVRTVDASPADVSGLLGGTPAGAKSLPAFAGTLREGAVLARSGDDVIAAQGVVGQGSVTLLGINPAEPWIDESDARATLWRNLLPFSPNQMGISPGGPRDDSMVVYSLNNLPAVELPSTETLFVLLFAYILLIGPANYFVLRRLDKREWAWVTMPALVVVFAVASYGTGATLKGSDVIINQIAIVRGAQGSETGLAQVYVGIFSPTRRSYDVRIPGGALLSNPVSQTGQYGQPEVPLDILFGDPSRVRNFEVGYGVLRGFRAEAPTSIPLIEADLRVVQGKLAGTLTNRSDQPLENAAIVYGGAISLLREVAPGEAKAVDLQTTGATNYGYQLSERIMGSAYSNDPAVQRVTATRRAVIDQLSDYGSMLAGATPQTPVLLAWQPGAALEVDLPGDTPSHVGDRLFMLPLTAEIDSDAVFGDALLTKTIIESKAVEAWGDGNGFYLTRGMMSLAIRPPGLAGRFRVKSLELALTNGEFRSLTGRGEEAAPLPADQQPDQDDPVNSAPPPVDEGDEPIKNPGFNFGQPRLPAYQLFDRSAGKWLEFAAPAPFRSYVISNPERYVDDSGTLQARFVNRGGGGDEGWFQFLVRMDGVIE